MKNCRRPIRHFFSYVFKSFTLLFLFYWVIVPVRPVFALTSQSQPPQSQIDPEGKPGFKGGQDLGYFIWRDAVGNWSVRANGDGEVHTFTGVITTTEAIGNFTAVSIENNDFLAQEGYRIEWELKAGTWIDGFDFALTGEGDLTFDIYIDDQREASFVFLGAGNNNPETIPFMIE